jgi:hypothetical protein
VQWRALPEFFRRRPSVAPAGFLEGETELVPTAGGADGSGQDG